MIGIHHLDAFHEFVPWNSRVSWRIAPWGSWQIWAQSASHAVELIGRTSAAGTWVRVPTVAGLQLLCRDTTDGELTLLLWKIEGGRRLPVLKARSTQAGLETGGREWGSAWVHPGSS
jgi:tocopherol cyclase